MRDMWTWQKDELLLDATFLFYGVLYFLGRFGLVARGYGYMLLSHTYLYIYS